MKPEHLAKEAERLGKDEVLLYALADLRREAIEELATADVDNRTQILRLQQRVAACDDILAKLAGYIDIQQVAENSAPVV